MKCAHREAESAREHVQLRVGESWSYSTCKGRTLRTKLGTVMGFTARTTYCYLCSTSHGQTCLWMSTENMSMPLPPKDNTVRFNFKFPTFVVFLEEMLAENYLRIPHLPSSSTIIKGLVSRYALHHNGRLVALPTDIHDDPCVKSICTHRLDWKRSTSIRPLDVK